MPALPLGEEDVKAIAEYIHSVAFTMRGQGSPPPGEEVELNIVVGDAKAGEAYFAAKCASCHSASGDLKGVGERIASPLQLQNTWVAGGGGRGRGGAGGPRVPSGHGVGRHAGWLEGRRPLVRIDDFYVVVGARGRVAANLPAQRRHAEGRPSTIRSKGIASC